jgi:phosphopantetheinyl transferase (holo-ACP synthase)
MEVLKSPLDGSPRLRLHRSTLYFSLLQELSRWTISISHDIGIAIAISVVEESTHTNPHRPKSQDALRRR